MRPLILLLLTCNLALAIHPPKGKKPPKPVYTHVSGVITDKTEMAGGTRFIHVKGSDADYTCMQKQFDPKFRLYQTGDKVIIGGYKAPDSKVVDRCTVDLWTSTAATAQ
jgi:hypothetical protein